MNDELKKRFEEGEKQAATAKADWYKALREALNEVSQKGWEIGFTIKEVERNI
jgi:phosphoglycolate phosphatase-like HAD superfamily hydrolase